MTVNLLAVLQTTIVRTIVRVAIVVTLVTLVIGGADVPIGGGWAA
jgi:hypothetical protein